MALVLHPIGLLARWRATYWFLPSILTAAAVVLAVALTAIDRLSPDATAWLGWAYGGGADGARALLSAVAGSMITVVSVTFSVMVVALTVSSQHFGPLLLRSFMRDQPAQLVLGTFTGTFAYCLMVLRTVQGDGGDRYAFFVPHLGVAGAVVLALLAVVLLIYYVHHIALSMQVSEITRRIAHDLEHVIERLYPDPIGEGTEPPVPEPPPVPGDARLVAAPETGYVQAIDGDRVLELAREVDSPIWLTARPGDFVIKGEPIAAIGRTDGSAGRCVEGVGRAYAFGDDRTSQQDVGFGIQQLVEMALRALSPGVNEPFTAITVIDRLAQAMRMLASRRIPSAIRTGGDGAMRVIAEAPAFPQLLAEAFEPIARHGASQPPIVARLLQSAERVALAVRRTEDRMALLRLVDAIWRAAARDLADDTDRDRLARQRDRTLETLQRQAFRLC